MTFAVVKEINGEKTVVNFIEAKPGFIPNSGFIISKSDNTFIGSVVMDDGTVVPPANVNQEWIITDAKSTLEAIAMSKNYDSIDSMRMAINTEKWHDDGVIGNSAYEAVWSSIIDYQKKVEIAKTAKQRLALLGEYEAELYNIAGNFIHEEDVSEDTPDEPPTNIKR